MKMTLMIFTDIIKDGGNVAAKYDENKRVRVLLVQTQTQFKALSEAKPNLFFTDTTFGTSLPFLILFLIRVTIEDSQRVVCRRILSTSTSYYSDSGEVECLLELLK